MSDWKVPRDRVERTSKSGRCGRCRRSYERVPGELNLCPTCRDDRSIRERMRAAQNEGSGTTDG